MSFRARIFLLALSLVTVVVAIVVYSGWTSMLGHETHRLEIRMCVEARRLAGEPRRDPDSARLAGDLVTKLHLQEPKQLAFSLESDLAGASVQTSNWASVQSSIRPDWRPLGDVEQSLASCAVGEGTYNAGRWLWARMTGRTGTAIVGVDLGAARQDLRRQMSSTLATVLTVSLVLAILVAWLIAAAAMRPVARLRTAMREIGSASLERRLTDAGEDNEFRELIATYNDMLARLQASFEQASRFSADAAHELMTPLTILRGRIEEARRHEEREATLREWDELLDEVSRLTAIVRKLLLLSRADSGQLNIERQLVDLAVLLRESVDSAQMSSAIDIQAHIESCLTVEADPTLLQQLVNNLLSNALRYCTVPGWIRIEGKCDGSKVVVRIANASAPLSAETRSHLFERFYRSDSARTRQSGGVGLGLSIAREIAVAHGGSLVLDNVPENEVSLTLRLPLHR